MQQRGNKTVRLSIYNIEAYNNKLYYYCKVINEINKPFPDSLWVLYALSRNIMIW